MKRLSVRFTAPGAVEVREEPVPEPGPGEVRVATEVSAISPGTELLAYRGLLPAELPLDATLPALAGQRGYPLKYGYAAAGRVEAVGPGVESAWLGRPVFAFHPHESRFVAPVAELLALPAGLSFEAATLLPTMETAVNLLLDGRPAVGERVVVVGQGVVGLAVTAVLAALPLERLVTLDLHALRREASLALGAGESLDPRAAGAEARLDELLGRGVPDQDGPGGGPAEAAGDDEVPGGADLVYELSGDPAALDTAIAAAGFGARVVVGSWYGEKTAPLRLGGRFHRDRIRLVSSQVSTLAPELRGRWNRRRRWRTALAELPRLPLERVVTHRFPVAEAAAAYALLDEHPERAIQILLTHGDR